MAVCNSSMGLDCADKRGGVGDFVGGGGGSAGRSWGFISIHEDVSFVCVEEINMYILTMVVIMEPRNCSYGGSD